MSRPSSKQLEKALVAELQGLQRIHIAVANQITRLKCEESVLQQLLEKAEQAEADGIGIMLSAAFKTKK
ncbi:g3393 [Coccomyxa elongata]